MKKKIEETQEELVRLNKFLSHNSNYSRREADKLIEEGRVKVNGKVEIRKRNQLTRGTIVSFDGNIVKIV